MTDPEKRKSLWQTIAETIQAEITAGHYRSGDKLPTEARLAARFGVNRHTVRRALTDLHDRGITVSKRGAGVFVTAPMTDYPIGKRVRFHANLLAAGRTPEKSVLRLETRPCDADEAQALNLTQGAAVHIYEGISLSDGVPIALFCSCFPVDRLPGIAAALDQTTSVTAALATCGVSDYTRAWTRLTAKPATATQAGILRIPQAAPVLRSRGVNIDPDGAPVEYGQSWFVGDRVTLTLDTA